MSKPDERLVEMFDYYLGVDLTEERHKEFLMELAYFFSELAKKSITEFYSPQMVIDKVTAPTKAKGDFNGTN